MKKNTFALLCGCLLVFTGFSHAETPSVQEILDKAIEATGGRDAHEAIKNRVAEGTFTLVGMGVDAEFTNYIDPPNVYTDIFLGAFGSVERGLFEGVAWELSPMEGPKVLEGEEADSQKRQAALNEFINWKKHYSEAKVLGEGDVEGTPAWEVEFTTASGKKLKHYFGKENGFMLQTVADNVTTLYGDFKEADGVTLPHSITTKGGQYGIEISIAKFDHNAEIPKDKFALPAAIEELLGGSEDQAAAETE